MLLAWLSAQSFFKDVESSLVNVDLKNTDSNGLNSKPLRYAPWNGEFWFRYKDHWVAFRRVEKKNDGSFFCR